MTPRSKCSSISSSVLLACWLGACGGSGERAAEDAYDWQLPKSFPVPKVPEDNAMSAEKVELGRRLFYDVRLSLNGTQSCGSCHQQALAFSDGLPGGIGSTGVVNRRSSMSLANVAYNSAQTWANPLLRTLEQQVLVPLFGDNPVELGFAGNEDELVQRLRDEPLYPPLFEAAFPDAGADPVNLLNVGRAIASFERTLISGRSPYDAFTNGDESAVSDSAKRGAALFFGERFECHHCHGGFAFSTSVTWRGQSTDALFYHNDALYNLDEDGAYPLRDQGLAEVTGHSDDMGKFRPPTLRNIAITAPYMHDGSIASLRAVIEDHYARGGRLIESGPDAGNGARNPLKSAFVSGFTIEPGELDDLLAFLESLTDTQFLSDPRFADPW